jgi:putative ABC transport system permease protein
MPATVLRLLRADLRARPGAALLLGLLIAAAALTLCTTLALRAQMDQPFDRVVAQTHGADLHAVTTRPGAPDLRPLTTLPGVAVASGPKPSLLLSARVGRNAAQVALEGIGRPPAVDRPAVRSGTWLSGAAGEVVLERSLAKAAGLGPGDVFTVIAHGRSHRLRVVGTAVSTEVGPFERWTPGLAWAAPSTLRAIGTDTLQAVDLRLRPGADVEQVIRAAQRAVPSSALAFYTRAEVRRSVSERVESVSFLLQANTVMSLLAVAFTIATAIGGRVLAQRRHIGLLKAIGLSPAAVTASLLLTYVAIAAVAATVGVAGGALLSHAVLASLADALNTTTPSGFDPGVIVMSYVVIVAAVAAATALPAWRAGRLATTEALRPQRTHGAERHALLAGAAARLRLPVAVRFGAKDAFAVRTRAALTIGSLVLLTVAAMSTLSGEAVFHRVISDPSLRAKPYELALESQALPAQRVRGLALAQRADVTAATTYDDERATVAGRGTEIRTGILGDQPKAFAYATPDGRGLERPGEALAGRGLLDALGKHVGDTISIRVLDAPVTLRIVGRHVEPDDDGMVLRFLSGSLPAAARRRLQPDTVLVRVADRHRAPAVAAAVQRAAHGMLTPTVTDDEVRQERDDLRPAMLAMTLVLLAVAVANLIATLVLGVREREEDLAVFKALGATPGQLRLAIATVAALLAIPAVLVGVPVGLLSFRALIDAGNPSDGPDLHALPPVLSLALAALAVVVIAVLASSAPARRATALKPVSVLRAE